MDTEEKVAICPYCGGLGTGDDEPCYDCDGWNCTCMENPDERCYVCIGHGD